MSKLPQIKPKIIKKVLIKLGFSSRSGKGSHTVFKHPDGRRTVIPMHNKPVRVGTLRAILKQADLTSEKFLSLIKINQIQISCTPVGCATFTPKYT